MPSNRPRAWADLTFNVIALAAGTAQAFNLLTNAPTVDTLTSVRIIVDLTFMYSPDVTVVDSLSTVSMGIGVVSVEAFAQGIASLPSPHNGTEFPARGWLYVNTRPVTQQAESTGIISRELRFALDLGAMRRIDKGVLFLVMRQDNIIVGGTMRVVGRTRVLCLA